ANLGEKRSDSRDLHDARSHGDARSAPPAALGVLAANRSLGHFTVSGAIQFVVRVNAAGAGRIGWATRWPAPAAASSRDVAFFVATGRGPSPPACSPRGRSPRCAGHRAAVRLR